MLIIYLCSTCIELDESVIGLLESINITPIMDQIISDVTRYSQIPLAYPKVDLCYVMIYSKLYYMTEVTLLGYKNTMVSNLWGHIDYTMELLSHRGWVTKEQHGGIVKY